MGKNQNFYYIAKKDISDSEREKIENGLFEYRREYSHVVAIGLGNKYNDSVYTITTSGTIPNDDFLSEIGLERVRIVR